MIKLNILLYKMPCIELEANKFFFLIYLFIKKAK